MPLSVRLDLATVAQVSEELSSRPHQNFILIHQDEDTGEWIIDLNERMEGMQVVEILHSFQGRMIDLIREQQKEIAIPENEFDLSNQFENQ